MAMDDTEMPRLAMLIDADNMSFKFLPTILRELPKHGVATYRRIYGDFTDPQAAGWRSTLLDNPIVPVQQFSNVKSHKPGETAGKNATDSTLIIDAMGILYAGNVDGFVIVSSDSDFTRLAQRLRESNMLVIGMGRNNTSISFRHACTSFVNIEYLSTADEGDDSTTPQEPGAVVTTITQKDVEDVVAGIVETYESKGMPAHLGAVGTSIHNKFSDFDVRTFGYTKLYQMIDDMKRFSVREENGVYYVEFANVHGERDKVVSYMRKRLAKAPKHTMPLSALGQAIRERFPSFRYKDLGYAQLWRFVDSVDGIRVIDHQRVRLTRGL